MGHVRRLRGVRDGTDLTSFAGAMTMNVVKMSSPSLIRFPDIRAGLATERVSHGATIWARVDRSPGHSLAFDNLKHHPDGWLFGDNGWTKRRVVFDVPPEGVSLCRGLLEGIGYSVGRRLKSYRGG